MLVSCVYNNEKCYAENFERFWHNEYGNCFTFNGATNKTVKKTSVAGPDFGLQLELNVCK